MTELAEALQAQGLQLTVWCAQPTLTEHHTRYPKRLIHHGILIQRVWSTQFPKKNFWGKLLNHLSFGLSILIKGLLSRDKSPILVFTNPPFLGILAAWISKLKNRKMVYVVFDLYPDTAIACDLLSDQHWLSRLWRRANLICYRQATHIVVLGRCMRAKLQPQLPPELHDKLHEITVWGDDTNITPSSSSSSSSSLTLLYAGNLGRFHDVETFAEAARALQGHPHLHWRFVGDGYKKAWLSRFITTHALTQVSLEPFVPRPQLRALLTSADIGLVSLLPSQVGLSVPSKTFGLMAAGLPMIGVLPPDCEIAHILRTYNCGLVVEPGNTDALVEAIHTLANDPELRLTLGKNARKALEDHYTVRQAAEKYKELLLNGW